MISPGINNIAIYTIKGVEYRFIIYGVSKFNAVYLLENPMPYIYIKCISKKPLIKFTTVTAILIKLEKLEIKNYFNRSETL